MTVFGQNGHEQKLHVVRVPARKVGARLFEQVPCKQSLLHWKVQKVFPTSLQESSEWLLQGVDTSLTCLTITTLGFMERVSKKVEPHDVTCSRDCTVTASVSLGRVQ